LLKGHRSRERYVNYKKFGHSNHPFLIVADSDIKLSGYSVSAGLGWVEKI